MADQKISQLSKITGANVDDTSDELAIVDTSGNETKAITRGELFSSVSQITTNGASTFNGPLTLNSSATITGNLTVSGTTTTVDTTNLNVEDAVITLNTGQATPLNDIGMLFQRYASATASNYNVVMAWDESVDKLIFGSTAEDGSDNTITFEDEWMTITSAGNVGIGLTSPNVKLDVSGSVTSRGNLVVGSDTAVGSNLFVNATTNFVGVNTAAPDASLHVTGTAKVQKTFAGREDFVKLSSSSTDYWTLAVNSSDTYAFYLWDEQNLSFPFAVKPGSNDGTLVVDAANDRVGVGITTPSTTLDVRGTTRIGDGAGNDMKLQGNVTPAVTVGGSTNAAVISSFGTGSGSGHVGIEVPSNDPNDGFYIATDADNDGTVDTLAVKVRADGNVGIKNTSPSADLDVSGDVQVSGKFITARTDLTIASGAVTATGSYHRIDTESAAATDDLTTINGAFGTGHRLVITPADSTRTIVVKDGTGNIILNNVLGDFTMDNVADTMELIYTGSNWLELSRSNNGA